jgi:hypothetical protein
MKRTTLLPLAALALSVACSERSLDPTEIDVPNLARVHFIGDASCTQVGTNLLCDFKVAGLGNISTATVTVQAPFACTKTNGGDQFVEPGGLASATQEGVPVSNGQITVTDFQVTGGPCPDHFGADFGAVATLIINGVTVGTIPIT